MNPFVLVLGLVLEANPASRGRERGRRRGRRDGSWVASTIPKSCIGTMTRFLVQPFVAYATKSCTWTPSRITREFGPVEERRTRTTTRTKGRFMGSFDDSEIVHRNHDPLFGTTFCCICNKKL